MHNETKCSLEERIERLESKQEARFDFESFAFAWKDTCWKIDNRLDACEQNYPSLWKRIEKIENRTHEPSPAIHSLDQRMDILEGLLNKIENKNIDQQIKRIANLESSVNVHWKDREHFYNKLNEIVAFDNAIKESMTKLNERITAIVNDYNGMNLRRIEENTLISRRLSEIESMLCTNQKYSTTNPHRCPVCFGTTYQSPTTFDKCVACDGKGIVWG